jgi:hypothetical protein
MHGIYNINPLNTELNPIYHLLAFLGAHHILHIGKVRVKIVHTVLIDHLHLFVEFILSQFRENNAYLNDNVC